MKISTIPLEVLYKRDKITPAVERAIQSQEDFSKLSPSYCERVCRLKCKTPHLVRLTSSHVDILILQDHAAPNGKWDKWPGKQEKTQQTVIETIFNMAKKELGIGPRVSFRVSNMLKCNLEPRDLNKGKPPSTLVLQKCSPYLLEEIRATKPKVIISLSTSVTKILSHSLFKMSNTGNRGEFYQTDVNGHSCPVVITLHPRILSMIRQNSSGAMWGPDYFNVIKNDFIKALRLVTGDLEVKDLLDSVEKYKNQIKVCESLADIQAFLDTIKALPSDRVYSLDTETTSLDPMSEDARLLTIQFGYRDNCGVLQAVVVPLWHRQNTAYDPDVAWGMLIPFLTNKEIIKVLHNGKFDVLFIYHTKGVRLEGFTMDTMLLMHGLDSGIQGCLSLKTAIWDHAPETGLGGYETLLPKLSSVKEQEAEEDTDGGGENEHEGE